MRQCASALEKEVRRPYSGGLCPYPQMFRHLAGLLGGAASQQGAASTDDYEEIPSTVLRITLVPDSYTPCLGAALSPGLHSFPTSAGGHPNARHVVSVYPHAPANRTATASRASATRRAQTATVAARGCTGRTSQAGPRGAARQCTHCVTFRQQSAGRWPSRVWSPQALGREAATVTARAGAARALQRATAHAASDPTKPADATSAHCTVPNTVTAAAAASGAAHFWEIAPDRGSRGEQTNPPRRTTCAAKDSSACRTALSDHG